MYAGLRNCRWEANVNIIPYNYCWPYAQFVRAGWGLAWLILFTVLGTVVVSGAVLIKWIVEISGVY